MSWFSLGADVLDIGVRGFDPFDILLQPASHETTGTPILLCLRNSWSKQDSTTMLVNSLNLQIELKVVDPDFTRAVAHRLWQLWIGGLLALQEAKLEVTYNNEYDESVLAAKVMRADRLHSLWAQKGKLRTLHGSVRWHLLTHRK